MIPKDIDREKQSTSETGFVKSNSQLGATGKGSFVMVGDLSKLQCDFREIRQLLCSLDDAMNRQAALLQEQRKVTERSLESHWRLVRDLCLLTILLVMSIVSDLMERKYFDTVLRLRSGSDILVTLCACVLWVRSVLYGPFTENSGSTVFLTIALVVALPMVIRSLCGAIYNHCHTVNQNLSQTRSGVFCNILSSISRLPHLVYNAPLAFTSMQMFRKRRSHDMPVNSATPLIGTASFYENSQQTELVAAMGRNSASATGYGCIDCGAEVTGSAQGIETSAGDNQEECSDMGNDEDVTAEALATECGNAIGDTGIPPDTLTTRELSA